MSNTSLAVIGAVISSLLAQPAQAEFKPPLLRAVPAATRVPLLSPRAQATIAELDGSARGVQLVAHLSAAAQTSAGLRRFALEVQSVLHADRGNYLYALYRAVADHHIDSANAWANHLARLGVAIGITSGHFQHLDHLDPSAPMPDASDSVLSKTPMSRWIDNFVEVEYREGYRPFRRGSLSEVLQLTFKDGTILDIDMGADPLKQQDSVQLR